MQYSAVLCCIDGSVDHQGLWMLILDKLGKVEREESFINVDSFSDLESEIDLLQFVSLCEASLGHTALAIHSWTTLPWLSTAGPHCPGCPQLDHTALAVHSWTTLPWLSTAGPHCPGYPQLDHTALAIHQLDHTALAIHQLDHTALAIHSWTTLPWLSTSCRAFEHIILFLTGQLTTAPVPDTWCFS